MDKPVSRRTLLGGGLLAAGAAGASAVWAVADDSDRRQPGPKVPGLPESAAQPSSRAWDVGVIGDSLSFIGVTAGLAGNLGTGTCIFGQYSYLGTALALTRGRFRFGGNWATGGFTSRQVREQHLPSAVAARPAVCVVLAGGNDLNRLSQEETQDNLTAMVTALQSAGTLPILVTLPPIVLPDAEHKLRVTGFNIWLRQAARRLGLPLADFHAAVVDPSTGVYRTGYTADGVHQTGIGASAMGVELARVLNDIPGAAPAALLDSYTPAGALLTDVCQTGTGTWEVAPASAGRYERVTGDGWLGNKGVLASTSTFAYSIVGGLDSRPVAGHRMQLGFVVDAAKVPEGGSWSCLLADITSRASVCGYFQCTQPLTNSGGNPISLWEFEMPDVQSGADFVFIYSVQGASGINLGCAQVSVVDLTALGVA
jgi:lysophospholipase L1-like esterase